MPSHVPPHVVNAIDARAPSEKTNRSRHRKSFLDEHSQVILQFAHERATYPNSNRKSIRSLTVRIRQKDGGARKIAHTTVLRYLERTGLIQFWRA
jgi:hypothetical protein